MSPVERAAKVITADLRRGLYSAEEAGRDIAQALADAGVLLTDEDRAVLDAAEAHEAAMRCYLPPGRLHDCNVCGAVRARREAQS